MDSQRSVPSIKRPVPLKVAVPSRLALDEVDGAEEWQARYPSPPPPTPYRARHESPLDAQRYDPFRAMLSPVSPPRYASPEPDYEGEDPVDTLSDSVAFHLQARDVYDELQDFHFGEPPSPTSATSSTDEAGTPGATTYRIQGASEEGDYIIDRTILRPTAGHRRFDLGKSLASLTARSTATLRTVPSFTRSSSGETSPSPSDDGDEYDMPNAPPASLAASRRPSLAVSVATAVPLPLAEVTESLKRLAASLAPCHHGAELCFEEAVDHLEDVWARAEERGGSLVEVCVARERETCVDVDAPGLAYERGGLVYGPRDGIGLYASPRTALSVPARE
ncbi:hypothetical protein BD413DRAFT_615823 [Trametes elegans]|nr:hypothetical protein BD413DRAFT_615823 [Trametes elegans]